MSGSAPVESWYSEAPRYTYGRESAGAGTGHFTQLVWRGSKELGIAKARSPRTGKASGDGFKWLPPLTCPNPHLFLFPPQVIVVANYKPAGNVIGRYAENVLPPKN